MNLFGLMEISGSALQAERMRAEVVAANMANAETTRTASGAPYQRQHVVFAANQGANAQGNSGFFDSLTAAAGTAQLSLPMPAPLPLLGSSSPGQPAGGVHIAQVMADSAAPLKRYDPGHPDAGADGYVSYPDINPLTEMVDLMGATRAYGLNSSAVQAEKAMITSALEIAKA
ncbi:MAG TPA: flagellar basal body rod protein FlgC [Rhizomicrobium sp.]|nr:flagellar basal body rod protein FlgC [Rhizomicrobium sp.]